MLNPDVTELLDDPELGGGVPFVVVREVRQRTLAAGAEEQVTKKARYTATGNVQPADLEALQLYPEEDRSEKVIVIYTKFHFQLGEDRGSEYMPADIVVWDHEAWKVTRVNHWSKWGFTIAYATRMGGADLNGLE